MVLVNCKLCKKQFYAKPSWVRQGNGVYCSAKCHHTDSRNGKVVMCDTCGMETYKSQKALRGSKSGKFFCSKSCQTIWRNSEFTEEKHTNWKGGGHSYRLKMLKNGPEPICLLCRSSDLRILTVHHIDKNRKHNNIDNLAWLCHNCHHLVHHYPDELKRFMAAIV